MSGLEQAARAPYLPFFVDWRDRATFPGATGDAAATIEHVGVSAEADTFAEWLGPNTLPVEVTPGGRGVRV